MAAKKKISFCTTCMNRFDHAKIVLLQNLKSCAQYQDSIEFVFVNFLVDDSVVDFGRWLSNNVPLRFLESNYFKYYETRELSKWHASVAKNTATMLADAIFVVNNDADNFVRPEEVEFLLCRPMFDYVYHGFFRGGDGTYGQIGVRKEIFVELGGYNESFGPMGGQDGDLLARIKGAYPDLEVRRFQFRYALQNTKSEGLMHSTSHSVSWTRMNKENSVLSARLLEQRKFSLNQGDIGVATTRVHLIGVKSATAQVTVGSMETRRDFERVLVSLVGKIDVRENRGILWWGLVPFIAGISESPSVDDGNDGDSSRKGLLDLVSKLKNTWSSEGIWANNSNISDKNSISTSFLDALGCAFGILWASQHFWDPLSQIQKASLISSLSRLLNAGQHAFLVKDKRILLLQKIVIFLALEKTGEDFGNADISFDLEEALVEVTSVCAENGWWNDCSGHCHQCPVLISAYHCYCLLYAGERKSLDSERAQLMVERARKFSRDFVFLFSESGRAVQCCTNADSLGYTGFFAMLLLVDGHKDAPFSPSELKGLVCRSIALHCAQQNQYNFNAKAIPEPHLPLLLPFILLRLPENHSVWTAKSSCFPKLRRSAVKHFPLANMVTHRVSGNNVYVLSAKEDLSPNLGVDCCFSVRHCQLVQSTYSAVGVVTANSCEEKYAGALIDRSLAFYPLAIGGNRFTFLQDELLTNEVHRCVSVSSSEDNLGPFVKVICSSESLSIETFLRPCHGGHTRTHKIVSKKSFEMMESGYPIVTGPKTDVVDILRRPDCCAVVTTNGFSGTKVLESNLAVKGTITYHNVVLPVTQESCLKNDINEPGYLIPVLRYKLLPGETVNIVTYIQYWEFQ